MAEGDGRFVDQDLGMRRFSRAGRASYHDDRARSLSRHFFCFVRMDADREKIIDSITCYASDHSNLGLDSRVPMSNLAILRTYASKSPADFPPTILFGHTSSSLTIYDAFPKSLFHFLILPRPEAYPDLTIPDLSSLKSLLKKDKSRAEELIKSLQSDAEALKADIESEMVKRYGFKWDIWTGFHGAPSME